MGNIAQYILLMMNLIGIKKRECPQTYLVDGFVLYVHIPIIPAQNDV